MTFLKGGRGKQAPYVSTHVRTPEPIKPTLEPIIERFRTMVDKDGLTVEQATEQIEAQPLEGYYSREQILEAARSGLKQKKGAWVSMQKALTALFGEDVSIDDLTS